MRTQHGLLRLAVLTLAAFSTVQCGKKGLSGEVEIRMMPERPVVITSDVTVNWFGTTSKLKGPWFKFFVNIRNDADIPLVVQALNVEVMGMDEGGQLSTTTKDFDPGGYSYTLNSVVCNYGDLGMFWHQGSKEGTPIGSSGEKMYNDLPLFVGGAGDFCAGSTTPVGIWFYVGGMPKPPGSNFRFTVKVKPIGWFGTRTDQVERFEASATGYTQ